VRRATLIDFFQDLASADGPFLVHDDSFRTRTFSYKEVGRASAAFAARLTASGIAKGHKVVIFSENRPEWIVAFWGCLLIGAVAVPIDYRSSPDFLVRVARIVDAKVVLAGRTSRRFAAWNPPPSGLFTNSTGRPRARRLPSRSDATTWRKSSSRPERRPNRRAS
jgi:acyl-CoA synthetase (AMP-forming)/AMP-acid ligase II